MIIIKRGRITFYIEDENVIVSNGDLQFTSYNVYAFQNRAPFHEFRDTILNSKPNAFMSIIDVVELSTRTKVYGSSTRKPNLDGVDCEYRS